MKEITPVLTADDAAELTNKIRNCIEDAWDLLQIAYDQKAWQALGYVSWAAYVIAEFKMTARRSYQLLDYNSVCKSLSDSKGREPGFTSKEVDSKDTLTNPLPEKIVRPLVKVPEEKRADVLAAAVEASPNGKPTAKAVVAAVDSFLGKPAKPILPQVEEDCAEDNAKEVAREMEELEKDNRELERLNKSLTATDSGKEIASITKEFQSACGRNHQLNVENSEMKKGLAYRDRLLASVRKLLGVEENSQIVAAIMAMKEGHP